MAEKQTSRRVLAAAGAAAATRSGHDATADAVAVAAGAAEDDPSDGWLSEWFGPVSPRRKLWLFVSCTGTVGIVLALILLLNGHVPSQEPEATSISPPPQPVLGKPDSDPSPKLPDPFADVPVAETSVPEPMEEPAFPEPEPEPEPEPAVVSASESPRPDDDLDVRVELLPAPDDSNQGPTFSVSSARPLGDLNAGFDGDIAAEWQLSAVREGLANPWNNLERLVPLEPVEPLETAEQVVPTGSLQPRFETTQPREAAQFLPASFELIVTNGGPTAIDRLILQQTLPEALILGSAGAVHGVADRTLRWEVEHLGPQGTWSVPMTVIPGQDGPVTPLTTLEAVTSVSSSTLVRVPDIRLELRTEPFATLEKYHRVTFLMTNTGEVPLNHLSMQVQLSDNLWHRFGQQFQFYDINLDAGQTREALLHVKSKADGPATLVAKLVTEEGAEAGNSCEFTVIRPGERPVPTADRPRATVIPREPLPEPPARQPEPEPAPEPSRPTPEQPTPADDPFEKPVPPANPANTPRTPPGEDFPLLDDFPPAERTPEPAPGPADPFPDLPPSFGPAEPANDPTPSNGPANEPVPEQEDPFRIPSKQPDEPPPFE